MSAARRPLPPAPGLTDEQRTAVRRTNRKALSAAAKAERDRARRLSASEPRSEIDRPPAEWAQHHAMADRRRSAGKRRWTRLEILYDKGFVDADAFNAGEDLQRWYERGVVGVRDINTSGIASGKSPAGAEEAQLDALRSYLDAMAIVRREGGRRAERAVERVVCLDRPFEEVGRGLGLPPERVNELAREAREQIAAASGLDEVERERAVTRIRKRLRERVVRGMPPEQVRALVGAMLAAVARQRTGRRKGKARDRE